MSILRMVRSPALRRFLPFLTIHDMFKALNAEGTNIQDLVRGRARRVVDAIIGLTPSDEEMARAADVEVVGGTDVIDVMKVIAVIVVLDVVLDVIGILVVLGVRVNVIGVVRVSR